MTKNFSYVVIFENPVAPRAVNTGGIHPVRRRRSWHGNATITAVQSPEKLGVRARQTVVIRPTECAQFPHSENAPSQTS